MCVLPLERIVKMPAVITVPRRIVARVLLAGALAYLCLGLVAAWPSSVHGRDAGHDAGQTAPIFVTNTPAITPTAQPTLPAPTPAAPVDQYALRLWTETDFLAAFLVQVQSADRSSSREAARALDLLRYELLRRFPAAPSTPAARAQAITTVLAAPPGLVDPRWIMRGVIADALNAQRPLFDATARFERDGLAYELTALDLDLSGGLDAFVRVTYPAGAEGDSVVLEVAAVALLAADGVWRVPLAVPDYPAVPYSADSLRVEGLGDLNGDAQAEVAISTQQTGHLNRTLHVLGWRGDRMIDLAQPGTPITFGELTLAGAAPLVTEVYTLQSPRWDCIGTQRVVWTYSLNAFRPAPDPAGIRPQPTLACTLASLDPLYAQPVTRALASIDALLLGAARDEAGYVRGQLAAAVLTLLDGQRDLAIAQVRAARDAAVGDPWVTTQADAFITAANAGQPPLAVCGVMQAARAAEGDAICDASEVLSRVWEETPPRRDQPLAEQIAALGGQVIEQTTSREVGRLDREIVRFVLGTEQVWSFAPLQPDIYTVSRVDAVQPITDGGILSPDDAVQAAFILNDDPAAALAIAEATQRESTASSEIRYAGALALDLLGDRTAARAAYYALWADDPASAWGRAAALHLELR